MFRPNTNVEIYEGYFSYRSASTIWKTIMDVLNISKMVRETKRQNNEIAIKWLKLGLTPEVFFVNLNILRYRDQVTHSAKARYKKGFFIKNISVSKDVF